MGHGLMFILKGVQVASRDPQVRSLIGITFSMIVLASVVYRYVEGWRWIDAFYFSVMTVATVGYGDIAPQTDIGKLFTILYIFCGLGLFVATATAFADRMIKGSNTATSHTVTDDGKDGGRSL